MIDLDFIELHSPLFFAGKNWGTKISATSNTGTTTGLKLSYDKEEKEIHLVYGTKMTMIPREAAGNITPINPKDFGHDIKTDHTKPKTHKSHAMTANINKAQVSTPMGHVFEGLGAGKTNS
jgi:hypothetical protein